MGVVGFKRLDDDLALALDRIDHQSTLAAAFRFHQESNTFDGVRLGGAVVEHPTDIYQRAEGVADRDEPLAGTEGMDGRSFRLQRFDDRGKRHDERLAGNRDHHAVEDGERQRQAHGEGRTEARTRGDRDTTAKCLDRALDDVHTDAATGNVGDLVGVEGLEVLEGCNPDVIVTDINMPRLDGFGFIEGVRRNEKYRAVPILVLTTESDAEKKNRARQAGATGWIVKPFDPAKLIDAIERVTA